MNRILVIDDELAISELIGEVLKRAGYDVDIAFSGKQGIIRFDSTVYDLVVTDMCLPDISGLEVVRHIRGSRRSFVPILGISGTPWLLQRADCDATLPKPFPLRAFMDSVRRLIPERYTAVSPERAIAYADQPAC